MDKVSKKVNQVMNHFPRPIIYDLYWHSDIKKQPLIVFAHGYKGFKDWGAWGLMAEQLASEGIAVLKFNFSHNGGTLQQPIDFPDEHAFGQNTYSLEINDLKNILETVLQDWGRKYEFIDFNRLILMGHSRGGAVVSYVATQFPFIKKLITLASVSTWDRPFKLSEEELKEWQQSNVRFVKNLRTHQNLPHYYSFYEDYLKNHSKWDLKKAFRHRNIPHLVLHGAEDEAVDVQEAEILKSWNKAATLQLIPNTGHTFGMKHPWELIDLPAPMIQVVNEIIQFVKS